MSEKIKAIIGSKDRAEEVKRWIKEQGATNVEDFSYDCIDRIYFIDRDNRVKCWNAEYSYLFDIVELPEKKPILKVIKGSLTRGKEVIDTLIELGGVNTHKLSGVCNDRYYFINNQNTIGALLQKDGYFKDFKLEVLELSNNFKPFDKVLVRDCAEDPWFCDIFSHYDSNADRNYNCIGGPWHMAIPYETNEDKIGKVTD